jgi:predicted RNA-binding Zn ribbon-like protein
MPQTKQKSPFEFTGGSLCLDFANTVDNRTSERATELLTDYSRLLRWAEESGAVPKKTVDRLRVLAQDIPETAQLAARRAVQLRDAIYDVFSAVAQHRTVPSRALATMNQAVRDASEHAQIAYTNHDFAWEWVSPDRHLDAILWPVARTAAELLTSEDLANVRQCAFDTCAWLFVDRTKNHRRRWCDMKTCGNRDKARRYYQRQKTG